MPAVDSNSLAHDLSTMKSGGMQSTTNPEQKPQTIDLGRSNSDAQIPPFQAPSEFANLGDGGLLGDFLLDLQFEPGNSGWANNSQQTFETLPENLNHDGEAELHDKRKNPESVEDEEGDSKRRESEDKTVKKPGRKPLTEEPTTKRKAQNRAAQRAFRERKERHLKDLETKVEDLEKASEATNHENGRLRAQVTRLNAELKEYRKRLSLNGTGGGRSPPSAASFSSQNRSFYHDNDFQFAFPKFGDLTGSNFMTNGSLAKVGSTARENIKERSPSSIIPGVIRANSAGSRNGNSSFSPDILSRINSVDNVVYQSPTPGLSPTDDLDGILSTSSWATSQRSNSADNKIIENAMGASYYGKPPNARSGSAVSLTASPSSSLMSNHGVDSSAGTTPESSADSPDGRKPVEATLNTINEEATDQNKFNTYTTGLTSPVASVNGIDWLAQQNGGQFDPILFGDYRDPQDNILNNFEGFFNDAFLPQDFSSPFNTAEGTTYPAPKRDLIKEIEIQQNDVEDKQTVAKEELKKPHVPFENLWEQVQGCEKLQSGEIDIDNLCSQLKAKAKCSSSGAVIDQKDVESILGPAPTNTKGPMKMFC